MSLNRSGVFIVDFEQGNGGWVFGFEILCHKHWSLCVIIKAMQTKIQANLGWTFSF